MVFSKLLKVIQPNMAESLLKPTSSGSRALFYLLNDTLDNSLCYQKTSLYKQDCVLFRLKGMCYQDTKRWRKLECILLTESLKRLHVCDLYYQVFLKKQNYGYSKKITHKKKSLIVRVLRDWCQGKVKMNVSHAGYFQRNCSVS